LLLFGLPFQLFFPLLETEQLEFLLPLFVVVHLNFQVLQNHALTAQHKVDIVCGTLVIATNGFVGFELLDSSQNTTFGDLKFEDSSLDRKTLKNCATHLTFGKILKTVEPLQTAFDTIPLCFQRWQQYGPKVLFVHDQQLTIGCKQIVTNFNEIQKSTGDAVNSIPTIVGLFTFYACSGNIKKTNE
jgi:uncharacterized protein YsxB (DUF464 family)